MVAPPRAFTCGSFLCNLKALRVFHTSAHTSAMLSRSQRRSSDSSGVRGVRLTFSRAGRRADSIALQRAEKKCEVCTPGFQASSFESSSALRASSSRSGPVSLACWGARSRTLSIISIRVLSGMSECLKLHPLRVVLYEPRATLAYKLRTAKVASSALTVACRLQFKHFGVPAARAGKLLVGAFFRNVPVRQHNNAVGHAHGRK